MNQIASREAPIARIVPDLRIVDATVDRALDRVAPLFPLERFVAVNPFLGLSGTPFTAAAARASKVRGPMFMPRSHHQRAFREGRIEERDLRTALASLLARGESVPPLGAVLHALGAPEHPPQPSAATFADVLGDVMDVPVSSVVTDAISRFASAYFDEGQARWAMPFKNATPWSAWRRWARVDRGPDARGFTSLRAFFASLPEDPRQAIREAITGLAIPMAALDAYLDRSLVSVAGWASYARLRGFQASLRGEKDDTLLSFLAIRMAWDHGLRRGHADEYAAGAWTVALRSMSALDLHTLDREQRIDFVLLEAAEAAMRRQFFPRLAEAPKPAPATAPRVQAVFCIDVRSEVFRRALEAELEDLETVGFAGFFGVSMSYAPLGGQAMDRTPVLIRPKHALKEKAKAGRSDATARRERSERGVLASFKSAAVGGLAYVETLGPSALRSLLADGLGWKRTDGTHAESAPDVSTLSLTERVDTAEGILRGTSLGERLGEVLLLIGHGSTTVNNPHAASLRCGACGGHGGAPNARAAAAILNDPEVRQALRARGLSIPERTHVIAGFHDTTSDTVQLFAEGAPEHHRATIEALDEALRRAGAVARRERAARLGVRGDASESLLGRGLTWSEVRPEWGLAGNALFIAAKRERTRSIDLKGRAFLHSYDAAKDTSGAVLELILTAPVIVASWINLQYYGSTVDPQGLGAGDKTLHDVVGSLGVLEGHGGDLRAGLPWQSVHDGTRVVHEPLRLHVLIEAEEEAIEAVLRRHPAVRELIAHGWVHLFSLGNEGITRYVGSGWIAA